MKKAKNSGQTDQALPSWLHRYGVRHSDRNRQKFLAGAREVFERANELKQRGYDIEHVARAVATIHEKQMNELQAAMEAARRVPAAPHLVAQLEHDVRQWRKDTRTLIRALTSIGKADKARLALGPGALPSELLYKRHKQVQDGKQGGTTSGDMRRKQTALLAQQVAAKWDAFDAGPKPVPHRQRIAKLKQTFKLPRSTIVDILRDKGRRTPARKK